MKLYLVQHGKALSKEENEKRPLSDIGGKEAEDIALYLKKAGISVTTIYHSGKLRALQTAEIFADHISNNEIHEKDGIKAKDDVKELPLKIKEDEEMFIGHLPYMEKAVSYLVANNEDAQVLKFQNAGVVCLEKENNEYYIKWFINPDMCKNK